MEPVDGTLNWSIWHCFYACWICFCSHTLSTLLFHNPLRIWPQLFKIEKITTPPSMAAAAGYRVDNIQFLAWLSSYRSVYIKIIFIFTTHIYIYRPIDIGISRKIVLFFFLLTIYVYFGEGETQTLREILNDIPTKIIVRHSSKVNVDNQLVNIMYLTVL